MDYLDLDSFRSRYSDITVTAVPAKPQAVEEQETLPDCCDGAEGGGAGMMPADRVEIFPINMPSAPSNSMVMQQQHPLQLEEQQLKLNQEAAAYSNEYQQVLAKLEYTKYVQAQLQLMSNSNGFGELFYGLPSNQIQVPSNEADNSPNSGNIVDTYDNLLSVIAEMQRNLGPTAIGLRAPKERLLRDIAHARVLVRECILMLMRDHRHQQSHQLPSDE
ncbi:PREDICTED: uncharacterized protein LOC108610409 [Drosophila arizonae]|uniref:Uncharacterized protein LOC108610409 n=1 Tax=Drosophila arizonae TaxID=7263 RepID=A0ABM1NSP6_DROAR|nr:PREDICTED: uncharacterized protein LOC108610409 [Drosophila arizonae]